MKKVVVVCDFAGQKAPFNVYVGEPSAHRHPLFYQSTWLREERGGEMPAEAMESFAHLATTAREKNESFENLVVQAIGTEEQKAALAAANAAASERQSAAARWKGAGGLLGRLWGRGETDQ